MKMALATRRRPTTPSTVPPAMAAVWLGEGVGVGDVEEVVEDELFVVDEVEGLRKL